uniref:Uncharacterized protein n=1 Tax=Sphaerodactylus townsendi TaxID=933632 RepID=A0ACB8ETF3_9SAUR
MLLSVRQDQGRQDETLDETTRKKLCKDTFCEVCGAVLQFESQRISHYEGKKHAQKVRLYLQMHSEQEEGQEPGKQKKQYVNFQTDPNVDKNKYCRLCNMIFTSPIVAESHYLGKIHAKKLKQLSAQQDQHSAHSTQPELGLSLTSAVLEICHEKTSQDTDAKDLSFSSSVPFNLDNPEKYCKLCLAPFNNPLMARQHYVGKKHKRNEARQKLMAEIGPEGIPGESKASAVGAGNYICPICSISLTSLEMYQSHMKGNKHHMKVVPCPKAIFSLFKTPRVFSNDLYGQYDSGHQHILRDEWFPILDHLFESAKLVALVFKEEPVLLAKQLIFVSKHVGSSWQADKLWTKHEIYESEWDSHPGIHIIDNYSLGDASTVSPSTPASVLSSSTPLIHHSLCIYNFRKRY